MRKWLREGDRGGEGMEKPNGRPSVRPSACHAETSSICVFPAGRCAKHGHGGWVGMGLLEKGEVDDTGSARPRMLQAVSLGVP